MNKRKNQFTNPWTEEEIKIIENNYKNGDKYLKTLLPKRSIDSIKTKRIRKGFLIGNSSTKKGMKRGPVTEWNRREDKILKDFYPLLGYHQPKFHQSLTEMLEGKTQPQIRYRSEFVLRLQIDRQKDTRDDERRCIECVKVKKIESFNKNSNQCKGCKHKIYDEGRKDIFKTYFDRLTQGLEREGTLVPIKERKKLLDKIFEINGLPDKCFFEDEYCLSKEYVNRFPLEIGHIKPKSKGGTLDDPSNIIWICTRHNQMMGNRDLNELHQTIKSILKIHNG